MTSKNLPEITDHAFMRMLREQCATPKPMSRIAIELGVDVDDLCAWILAYKEPKRKPYVNRMSEPVTYAGMAIRSDDDYRRAAARFAAWKRQHDGVVETRRLLAEGQE